MVHESLGGVYLKVFIGRPSIFLNNVIEFTLDHVFRCFFPDVLEDLVQNLTVDSIYFILDYELYSLALHSFKELVDECVSSLSELVQLQDNVLVVCHLSQ